MASCTAHIDSKSQDLAIYIEVLHERTLAFQKFMEENCPELTTLDEIDWDEQYQSWLELDKA